MDWLSEAKRLFDGAKPEHFTNYRHCCECGEHDRTLLAATIDSIGLEELGNPGWDPMCFASAEGKKYYLPALIRLSLESIDDDFYFAQFLFHLEGDGPGNALFSACNEAQRCFILGFIEHMILSYPEILETHGCANDAFRVQAIWSATS